MELIYIVKGFSQVICEAVNNSTWAVCTLKLKPSLRICQEVNLETSTLLCQEAGILLGTHKCFAIQSQNSKPVPVEPFLFSSPWRGLLGCSRTKWKKKAKAFFQVLGLLTVGWNWINHSSTRIDCFFLSPLSWQCEPENSCNCLLSITVKAENLKTWLYSSAFLKTNFKTKREMFAFNDLLWYQTLGRSCS